MNDRALQPTVGEEDIVTVSGVRLRIDRQRYSELMIRILSENKYEGEERAIVPKFISPTDRILELGTAIGFVTMLAARVVGSDHIRGIDANPYMVNDALVNFSLNSMHIQIRNGVVKNTTTWEPGNVLFHVDRNFWSSSLTKTSTTVESVLIPSRCLENEIREFAANTLICDIEGGEVELFPGSDLRGLNKIMMEVHPRKVGQSAIYNAVRSIQRQGFSIDYENTWGGIVCFYRGF
ncbi:MAG TPA: hypothetical protein VHY35_09745 [Stellaceae bacterium]|jgi:FkbM family methyltransferase|nr:hypothetical protein [Stellaceae bacterium]